MDGQIDGWIDGWMDGWMDEKEGQSILSNFIDVMLWDVFFFLMFSFKIKEIMRIVK